MFSPFLIDIGYYHSHLKPTMHTFHLPFYLNIREYNSVARND